jgi:hypothetical protein
MADRFAKSGNAKLMKNQTTWKVFHIIGIAAFSKSLP